jgi:hypothetical protein
MDGEILSSKTRHNHSPSSKNGEGEVYSPSLFIGAESLIDRSGVLLSQRR